MQRIPGPLRVVLTGGIACGKTVISDDFKALGTTVIDTDVISRELSQPGSPMLKAIARALGNEVIAPDGSLLRRRVREIVFHDKSKLEKLNSITHPAIMGEALCRAQSAPGRYVILAVPLFFESKNRDYADRVLVADCSEQTQFKRLMERDGSPEDTARGILRSQVSREVRRKGADDLIETDKLSLNEIRDAVLNLHEKYSAIKV